jgi:hypothetical protein
MPNTTKKQTKRSNYRIWWMVLIVIAVISLGAFWYHKKHSNTSPIVHTNNGTITANPNVPGGTNPNPTTGSSASKDQAGNTPATAPNSGVQPATPTGQFVSNHQPNLSGSPTPNTETSTCTTTPGAECKITFTKGTVVKSLPAQNTDENGNTIWSNWNLQSVGLTAGSWQVAAVAFNGSKTASATDATTLVVAQ